VAYKNKKACSAKCLYRLRQNAAYFGGRMTEAVGWAEKVCQVCYRDVKAKYHVHHVYGHPNHDLLVVLCAGCHDLISKLAMRKTYGPRQYEIVQWCAWAQRNGKPPEGVPVPFQKAQPA